jgi:hypothetical protein
MGSMALGSMAPVSMALVSMAPGRRAVLPSSKPDQRFARIGPVGRYAIINTPYAIPPSALRSRAGGVYYLRILSFRILRMQFEQELPNSRASYRLADARWAVVVGPDADLREPATHTIQIVTEKSFAPPAPTIERRLRVRVHV